MVRQSEPETPTIRVLLVDDDEDDYRLTLAVTREITNAKVVLDWQSDFDTALEAICDGVHDVYLIDYRLGQKTGIDLLHALKEKKCSGPIILLTGQGEPEMRVVLERFLRRPHGQLARHAEVNEERRLRTERDQDPFPAPVDGRHGRARDLRVPSWLPGLP